MEFKLEKNTERIQVINHRETVVGKAQQKCR